MDYSADSGHELVVTLMHLEDCTPITAKIVVRILIFMNELLQS